MVLRLKRVIVALSLALVASPLTADTLVLFKNGKAMRVKSAIKDGKWFKCEFEEKNFISVPVDSVLRVEEAALGGTAGELRPNQVAVGTGGAYVPPSQGGMPDQAPINEGVTEDDVAAALAEEQAALANQVGVVGGRTNLRGGRGVPIQPGQQNQGVLQQLNQANTPFQNRRLNEQRGSNRNRIPLPTNPVPPPADE